MKKCMLNFFKYVIFIVMLLFTCGITAPPEPPENRDPVCIITFDDGYSSVYTLARPLMNFYGFKGNCFVVCGWAYSEEIPGGDPNIMSWEKLLVLHNEGWGIYNHTWNHQALPDSYEINSCYECLKSRGFNANVFAYPWGPYNDDVINLVKQNHVAARTGDWGLENHFDLSYSNIYKSKTIVVTSSVTPEEVKFQIDIAIEQNKVIVLTYHGFCDTLGCGVGHRNYIGDFAEVLNYLYEKREDIKVMTFKEYLGI